MDPAARGRYLTEEEREGLLRIARRAAASYLTEGKVPEENPRAEKLRVPGAAFVTLTRRGRLRGCIGHTEASAPLYRTVQECAIAAATEDPRFPPVTPREISSLRVEISVLTPLLPIRPEEVAVGVKLGVGGEAGQHRRLEIAVTHGRCSSLDLSRQDSALRSARPSSRGRR